MTGSEHYRQAEQHIEWAQVAGTDNPDGERAHLQYAQVHAQLANAAATMSVTFALQAAAGIGPSTAVQLWAAALTPAETRR